MIDTEKEVSSDLVIDNDVPEATARKIKEYRSEYADIACRLAAAYFTEQDIAYALGVSLSTIQTWKRNYSTFKRACEDGRREQKKRLVARAMKQACGYKYTEFNVKEILNPAGEVLKREKSEFHRENPGNERLLVFLLCNLDRQLKDDEWHATNRVEVEETKSVTINIDGHHARDQIKKLSGDLLTNGMDGL